MNYAIIHVADIHYRKDAPEGASSIMKAFLEDLRKQMNALPNHKFYITFVGDIVRKGEDFNSFEAFIHEMDGQLKEIGLEKDKRIIVPGNHDLNRLAIEKDFEDITQAYDQHAVEEEKFNDFMNSSTLLTGHFSNYEKFIRQFARCDESFKTGGWGCGLNEEVGVYCLNTALCSFGGFKGINDERRLAICTRDLVEWCRKTTYPVKILLHHHPLDHLNSWSQTELRHIIENNFTVCLSGHIHEPELFYSYVPQKALMCTAPPLYCGKGCLLAYSIILIENNVPSSIIYREYSQGDFFPSSKLAKTENGKVDLGNVHLRHIEEMETQLQHALESFKGQPATFIEPKLSKQREFNNDANELHTLIDSPYDTLIIAPPQFGLTCLGLHMRLKAFKKNNFWLYIDAKHTKARKICDFIDEELLHFNQGLSNLKCIVLDSWDIGEIDHLTMVKNVSAKYPSIPLVILTEDSLFLDTTGNLSKLDRDFKHLHLQALSRNSMRQLIAGYNEIKHIGTEDVILSSLAEHLESINVHRTPLNCFTLLRVLDSRYNEALLNKTKLLKAILFVLFTDSDSFSFLSHKPDVEECAFVLGRFCKDLVKQATRSFDASTFTVKLNDICKEQSIVLNVDAMIGVLLENNILVKYGNQMEFRHRYWIFYFAAEWMRHDDDFRQFILKERNYVNYPEIIEFYSGIDGKRTDIMETLLADLTSLVDQVDMSIGIDSSFDPLSSFLWNPSDEYIQQTKSQIADKVESSNLPPEIKDKHADKHYQSVAPYNQSIGKFMNDYSVLSLLHAIKAASRALRSSPFVDVELKHKTTNAILCGWTEISRVIFWLSPILATKGRAARDGFALMLDDGFSDNLDERFKEIIISNHGNVVDMLRWDLASKKIGPLLYECFKAMDSKPQKHMMALFIATVRPIGWYDATLNYIDLLHPRSFYLGNLMARLNEEITLGDLEQGEETALKQLTGAILSKREYAPKVSSTKDIPLNKILSDENRMPIDKLLKGNKRKWPFKS
jgi:predicted MPP superfamily phosphohydrolase